MKEFYYSFMNANGLYIPGSFEGNGAEEQMNALIKNFKEYSADWEILFIHEYKNDALVKSVRYQKRPGGVIYKNEVEG